MRNRFPVLASFSVISTHMVPKSAPLPQIHIGAASDPACMRKLRTLEDHWRMPHVTFGDRAGRCTRVLARPLATAVTAATATAHCSEAGCGAKVTTERAMGTTRDGGSRGGSTHSICRAAGRAPRDTLPIWAPHVALTAGVRLARTPTLAATTRPAPLAGQVRTAPSRPRAGAPWARRPRQRRCP